MALFLEILEGPGEGQKFRLLPGIRIGRSVGEIIVADPKVSSLHAQVENSENGQLFLVDRGSSNGIRINGQKVQKAAMLSGVRFSIGKTLFRVVEVIAEPSPLPDLEVGNGWKEVLQTKVPQLPSTNRSSRASVQPLCPLIELDFLEGIQAEYKIVLGYGPRKAGSDVLDIELQDPLAPDIAFEILPLEDGSIQFQTAYPDIVQLNDTSVNEGILKPGDRIRVGSSLIEVKFLT